MSPLMNLYQQVGLNDPRLQRPSMGETFSSFNLKHCLHPLVLRTDGEQPFEAVITSCISSSEQTPVWAKKERKAGKITRTWPSVDTDNAEAGTTRSILDLHGLLHPLGTP